MIRAITKLWIAIALLPAASHGAKRALEPIGKGIFLFDHGSNRSTPLDGPPKPNRVYVTFSEEFNDWVFVLTDKQGNFPRPKEVLVSGSVVQGAQIGAAGGQRFRFVSGGRWIASSEPRRLRLIVLGEIPTYKTVTFEPLSDSQIGFVNPDRKVDLKTHDFLSGR